MIPVQKTVDDDENMKAIMLVYKDPTIWEKVVRSLVCSTHERPIGFNLQQTSAERPASNVIHGMLCDIYRLDFEDMPTLCRF